MFSKFRRRLFVLLSLLFSGLYVGSANAALLGLDGATMFTGASDDVKSVGLAVAGVMVIVTVFGLVFSLVRR